MKNPFSFKEVPVDGPFCNRKQEMSKLMSHATNFANVAIFSPRRYGKTSMAKRVQDGLAKKGYFTAYINFYGTSSVDSLAAEVAAGLYAVAHHNESLLKKAMRFLSPWRPVFKPDTETGLNMTVEPVGSRRGFELLRETIEGLGAFVKDHPVGCQIVFDEFQELTELPDSLSIEGLLRTHIQTHTTASYFFVGSRRRALKDMINQRKRPFYQSAINFPVDPLPLDEATSFVVERFQAAGVICPEKIAQKVVEKVHGYPYYIQRVPYSIFEICGSTVTEEDYIAGFRQAIEEESTVYEIMLKTVAPQQVALLRALAKEPTDKPFALHYMGAHHLGSIGGVQSALKRLDRLDYIEIVDGAYQVVDPVFAMWLRNSPL
jgi:hypothetical protein